MKAQKEAGRVPDYAGVSELIVKRFSNYPEVSFAGYFFRSHFPKCLLPIISHKMV